MVELIIMVVNRRYDVKINAWVNKKGTYRKSIYGYVLLNVPLSVAEWAYDFFRENDIRVGIYPHRKDTQLVRHGNDGGRREVTVSSVMSWWNKWNY